MLSFKDVALVIYQNQRRRHQRASDWHSATWQRRPRYRLYFRLLKPRAARRKCSRGRLPEISTF